MTLQRSDVAIDVPLHWPGPITRSRRRRGLAALAAVWLLGAALIASGSTPLLAAGVSLWVPGAGFLVGPHWFAFPVALLLAGWAAARTVSRGDHVTPVAVHLAMAALSGLMTHGQRSTWPVPAAAVVVTALCIRAAMRRRATVAAAVPPATTRPRERDLAPLHALSGSDLGVQRWLLDRALQPQDEWHGYDERDQYTLKSLRYQLAWSQWALALAHAEATPAFDGYTEEAQRRLIDRVTDPLVWSYWRRENLWGNLRTSADPIARDNVMLGGFLLAMLGSYRASTGKDRYDAPGSLTFAGRHGTFAYHHSSVRDAVVQNLERSPTTSYACEPGLVFPLCNSIAMAGLAQVNRQHAAALWPQHHRSLVEEFTFPDGLIPFFQWTRGGNVPYAARDVTNSAVVAYFLSAVDPEYAGRAWDRWRDSAMGVLAAPTPVGGDWGTGRRSPVTALAFLAMLAGAVGDVEAHALALARADELLDPQTMGGATAYESASVTGNAMLAVARWSTGGAWRRLVTSPTQPMGPRLTGLAYPDVLVHAAHTEGPELTAVLRSGVGAGVASVAFSGLAPGGQRAFVDGVPVELTADGSGNASLSLSLTSRAATHLRVAGG